MTRGVMLLGWDPGVEVPPKNTPLLRVHGMLAPVGDGLSARSHPARVGRNLHQRISHLAAGLDPSQVSLNPVAGAGFVCSGEPMVWKPFFPPFPSFSLPQHAWVGMCKALPASSARRVSWGPPWCSCVPVLDVVVTLGHGQCWAAGEPHSWLSSLSVVGRCPSHRSMWEAGLGIC